MDQRDLLRHLENVADALGIIVRYEKLGDDTDMPSAKSGSCRLRSDRIILIDSGLSMAEKCRALAEELKRCDISNIYIPPAVRRLISDPENEY